MAQEPFPWEDTEDTIEVSFFLNTNFDLFANKLNSYTQRKHNWGFPMGKGRVYPQAARQVAWRDPHWRMIAIEGPYAENGTRFTGQTITLIEFKVGQPSSERIEVVARCVESVAKDYFWELIMEIARCYPEAQEQIKAAAMAQSERVIEEANRELRGAKPQADSGAMTEQVTPAEDEDSSLIKILFLAANPADTDRLRLDAEMRAIDLALQQALFRDRFDLRQHWAVQVTDLQHCLLRHQPDIVHFSGHGSVSSEIILEDDSGNSRPVSVRALSTLFSVLKDNIKCVVLNACYSEQQAQAIAQSIDCVIGMSKAIGDDAAIGFATAFYRALGFGRDVKTAFELGRVQIDLEGLDEQDTPKLLALKIPPENILFIKQAQ